MTELTKHTRLVAHLLAFMLTVTTVIYGIPPELTAEASSVDTMMSKIPESEPGGMKITWYDAKRGTSYRTGMDDFLKIDQDNRYGTADEEQSLTAF